MNGFPPPTVSPVGPVAESNSWQRRGKFGKVSIVGGGVLAGLIALGVVLPAPDDADTLAATDIAAVEEPPATVAPADSQASITTEVSVTSDAPPVAPSPTPSPITTDSPTAVAPALTVARIIDGDTVEMSDGSTVRLIGIDSPDRGDCGYQEASDTLAMIVYGQAVTLTPGARDDTDKYDRLLRYLDTGNGVDANLAMIESGQAIARYDSRDGYGRHTREDAFVAADTATAAFCSAPPAAVVAAAPAVTAAPPVVPQPPTNVSYANCDSVRAAGAAPIYVGDRGFQAKFDRDNDGVGCE